MYRHPACPENVNVPFGNCYTSPKGMLVQSCTFSVPMLNCIHSAGDFNPYRIIRRINVNLTEEIRRDPFLLAVEIPSNWHPSPQSVIHTLTLTWRWEAARLLMRARRGRL